MHGTEDDYTELEVNETTLIKQITTRIAQVTLQILLQLRQEWDHLEAKRTWQEHLQQDLLVLVVAAQRIIGEKEDLQAQTGAVWESLKRT